MLRFFRTLRRKLLEEDKFRKYFWYAIGEVFLVVIGILIALQINNWNEERLAIELVDQTLIEIKNNLERDLGSLEVNRVMSEEFIQNLMDLQEYGASLPFDSLNEKIDGMHRVVSFTPATYGYNKLTGIEVPAQVPDSLIKELAAYYTIYSEGLNNTSYEDLSLYGLNKYRDYMIKKGFPASGRRLEEIKDKTIFLDLFNDLEFQGIIRNLHYSRQIQLSGFDQAENSVRNCIDLIDSYFLSNGMEVN